MVTSRVLLAAAAAAVLVAAIGSAPLADANVPISHPPTSSSSVRELRVPLEILHPNYNGPPRYVSATFLGTAHVSLDSSDEVRRIMSADDYDVVMLELCPEVSLSWCRFSACRC